MTRRELVDHWVESHGLGATIALTNGALLQTLEIAEVPSLVFVRDGRIVGVGRGEIAEQFVLAHAR